VTCPVATVETTGDVTTSTIRMTEYVCPSAGTYTINPTTTVCPEETVIVYPTPTTIVPGTYTRPETVVTVTETGFVTVCPYTSSGLPTSTPEPMPEPQPEPTPEPMPEPQPTTSAAPEPEKTKTPEKPQKPSGNGGVGPTTDTEQLGITYTCYTSETGECKSAQQVKKDIALLAKNGFKNIRIYGTDCNTLESVTPACEENGVKIVTGIFIKPGGSCSAQNPDIKKQIDDLASWARWDLVDLFVIGNEALMNGICTASELATLVQTVKSTCSSYTGPYTIAETLNIWQKSDVQSSICGVVDMVGANIHGFFNSQVAPSEAGQFVVSQLDLLDNICDGKQAINLECGWPSQGNANGVAVANANAQAEAIKSIKAAAGSRTFLFSFENDFWKNPGACDCEQSWGLMSALGL
jgi:exo-beta-1,3-glucanase (GH17 family)